MALAFLALMLQQPPAAAPAAPASPPAAYRIGPGSAGAPPTTDEDEAPGYTLLPLAPPPPPVLSHTGVSIDAYDPNVEVGRGPEDSAYEATVVGGAASAQGRQGPLDGAWILLDGGGAQLYAFQLADDGLGLGVEGAWRNVRAERRSGFVLVGRDGGRTTLRFFEPSGSSPILVTLEPAMDGSWRGQLVRDGTAAPVAMRRR